MFCELVVSIPPLLLLTLPTKERVCEQNAPCCKQDTRIWCKHTIHKYLPKVNHFPGLQHVYLFIIYCIGNIHTNSKKTTDIDSYSTAAVNVRSRLTVVTHYCFKN